MDGKPIGTAYVIAETKSNAQDQAFALEPQSPADAERSSTVILVLLNSQRGQKCEDVALPHTARNTRIMADAE